jgi:hypothetical protein
LVKLRVILIGRKAVALRPSFLMLDYPSTSKKSKRGAVH